MQEEFHSPFKRGRPPHSFRLAFTAVLALELILTLGGGCAASAGGQRGQGYGLRRMLKAKKGRLLEGTSCSYSTKTLVALVPDLNKFYLQAMGNTYFAYNTNDFADFSEVFPDLWNGANSTTLAFSQQIRSRIVAEMKSKKVSTLEKMQLGYVLSDVELFVNLTRLNLWHITLSEVSENGWLPDTPLLAKETATTLMKLTSPLSTPNLSKVLRWLGNYAAQVDGQIAYYKKTIAEKKTHANVTMALTFQAYYVPALEFNYVSLCYGVAGLYSPALLPQCLNSTEAVISQNLKLKAFYETEYLPACAAQRPDIKPGLLYVTDGPAAYEVYLRYHLGLTQTPLSIYELGKRLVEEGKASISATASLPLAQAVAMLTDTTNSSLYFCTANEGVTRDSVLAYYAMHRQTLGSFIDGVFNYYTRGQTYMGIDGTASTTWYPGSFDYATNSWTKSGLYNIGVIGKCEVTVGGKVVKGEVFEKLTALSLVAHEAFPGHGLQVPLQSEIGCPLSKYANGTPTSFQEGWALYCETLPLFMNVSTHTSDGLYTDTVQKLGWIQNDMLRNVRLAEDTGLHAFGWTFDQGKEYMMAAGISSDLAQFETYRYITLPGQAVAYKIGRIRIAAMKDATKKSLGTLYSEAEFHQVMTRFGGSTLDNLELLLKTYVSMKLDTLGTKNHDKEFGSELIASMTTASNPLVGRT